MKTLIPIILISIVLVIIIRCIKEPIQEPKEIWCGYCDEQELLTSETRCGTYREVNDWFYEKAQQNEFEKAKWICIIRKQ